MWALETIEKLHNDRDEDNVKKAALRTAIKKQVAQYVPQEEGDGNQINHSA